MHFIKLKKKEGNLIAAFSVATAKETHFTNNRGVLDVCLSSWEQEIELGKKGTTYNISLLCH